VLGILVQPRRNQEAAEAFLRRVVDGQGYGPRVVITDKRAGNHFRPRRHLLPAERYRELRAERFQQWREVVRLAPAA
jgi:transposase-like protein